MKPIKFKELNRLIKLAERSKDDPDGTSWTFRIGVLLSYNQAKEMLEALKQAEIDRWTCPICKGNLTCIQCTKILCTPSEFPK